MGKHVLVGVQSFFLDEENRGGVGLYVYINDDWVETNILVPRICACVWSKRTKKSTNYCMLSCFHISC
ncbi:hypothetical protein Syun_009366 [Stephania yunnanensis]|uniref:Uncharacterized protein n=1 Tax=Stephania yunnanensis TaxID=152371 RepID=A0AAP0PNZ3_9MAGN